MLSDAVFFIHTVTSIGRVVRWVCSALLGVAVVAGCDDSAPEATAPKASEPSAVDALENEQAPLPTAPLTTGLTVYDFTALAHTGQRFKLSRFLDRPALVYFCAGDQVALCQQIALSIRDHWLTLRPSISMAIGVTPDDTFVHRDFASEHELPHLMVADTDSTVHQVFGLQPGVTVSYLVGKNREVLHVFSPPSGAQHAQELSTVLQQLGLMQPPALP